MMHGREKSDSVIVAVKPAVQDGASSSRLSAARRRGRWRRADSSQSGCGGSARSCRWPRRIPKERPASQRSSRGCSNWAGPLAATC